MWKTLVTPNMDNHYKTASKLLAAPLIVAVYFVIYGHTLILVDDLLPFAQQSTWGVVAIVSIQGLVLASVSAALLALPLAWLYGRIAPVIALLCVAPIVVLSWKNPFGNASIPSVLAADIEMMLLILIVPTLTEHARLRLKGYKVKRRLLF